MDRKVWFVLICVAVQFVDLKRTLDSDRVENSKEQAEVLQTDFRFQILQVKYELLTCISSNVSAVNVTCRIRVYSRYHISYEVSADLIRPISKVYVNIRHFQFLICFHMNPPLSLTSQFTTSHQTEDSTTKTALKTWKSATSCSSWIPNLHLVGLLTT
jgi:hypothetical protein